MTLIKLLLRYLLSRGSSVETRTAQSARGVSLPLSQKVWSLKCHDVYGPSCTIIFCEILDPRSPLGKTAMHDLRRQGSLHTPLVAKSGGCRRQKRLPQNPQKIPVKSDSCLPFSRENDLLSHITYPPLSLCFTVVSFKPFTV